jgi:hypothetical protein
VRFSLHNIVVYTIYIRFEIFILFSFRYEYTRTIRESLPIPYLKALRPTSVFSLEKDSCLAYLPRTRFSEPSGFTI